MKKFSLTPEARGDLRDISRYTDKMWGRRQRFIYIKRLNERFSYLADHPEKGRKRDEIASSPLSYHESRHVIFYRTLAEGIEILRVLHDSMDFPRHFE